MNDLFSVKDKIVILTGGSGFLGQQYTEALTASGARVLNWDLKTGIDITDAAGLKKEAAAVIENHGRIDVLINNAAFNPQVDSTSSPPVGLEDCWAPYEEFSLDLWDREFVINAKAQMAVTQAIAPQMMKQQSGSIIFIVSDLALIGPANRIYDPGKFKDIAYASSKASVLGMMRFWAAYLGPHHVRANAIAFGGMEHNQTDEFKKKNGALNMLGRMSRAGEYNGAIIFLASEASSYMTGACLVVDGGRTTW